MWYKTIRLELIWYEQINDYRCSGENALTTHVAKTLNLEPYNPYLQVEESDTWNNGTQLTYDT